MTQFLINYIKFVLIDLLGSLNRISMDSHCISCSISQKPLRGVTSPTLCISFITQWYKKSVNVRKIIVSLLSTCSSLFITFVWNI